MPKQGVNDLRKIPLGLVLERMGGQPDPADPKRNFLHPEGRITVTEDKFYNHTRGEGGGGAIDLAMHLGGFKFKEAISWLAKEVGKEETIQQYMADARGRVERIAKETPVPKLGVPEPDSRRLAQVVNYLHNQRHIPMDLIKDALNSQNLWADKNGNCVFALKNEQGKTVGAEIRGTYSKPFHGTRGEKHEAFFYTGSPTHKTIAFTESGIEALSYRALHPDVLAVGTNGQRRETVVALSKKLQANGFEIVLAFNDDKPGRSMAEKISQDLEGRCRTDFPTAGSDWNEHLQAAYTPLQKPSALHIRKEAEQTSARPEPSPPLPSPVNPEKPPSSPVKPKTPGSQDIER